MSIKPKLPVLILTFVGLFTLVNGIIAFIYPPAIYPDPSWGFNVLRSMKMGSVFNIISQPDHTDISKNNSGFMSWWSPGQYLVPYFFANLLKISIGKAAALTVTICSLIGLSGLYAFFRRVGFTALVSSISIAFIACQQAYLTPYIFYNGGEIIIFAFLGWFLLGCAAFTKVDWLMVVFVLVSGVIGFFCKSAFLWIYLSGVLFLWIRLSTKKKFVTRIINGVSIGIPVILSLVIIYATYLSKGKNPASDTPGMKLAWETFSFPAASPLLSGFSIDDLTNGIINHPTGIIVALALINIFLVYHIYKSVPNANYKLLMVLFYVAAILFFGINFLRQANISYEARHMRIIGLIVTPGIIFVLGKLNRPYILLAAAMWLFIAYKGYKFMVTGFDRNANYASHGTTGFAQVAIDQLTLNYVRKLDELQHNAIFVFLSPELGLEVSHNRIITFEHGKAEKGLDIYLGHAGPIYIVMSKSIGANKASAYFKNFPGYSNFSEKSVGNDYVVYSAK